MEQLLLMLLNKISKLPNCGNAEVNDNIIEAHIAISAALAHFRRQKIIDRLKTKIEQNH